MNTSELVQPRHVNRRSVIYVRQSSPNQVITNKESQRMQYALRERAAALGWHEQDIQVIDADLGRSGATIEGRAGYQELVSRIALGEVGILLAFDATRLARNCSHWYQLLDLCSLHDCLIADRDGVYDPTSINGRLLLGLKGQISELELHTIRARLTAGILSKAERGAAHAPHFTSRVPAPEQNQVAWFKREDANGLFAVEYPANPFFAKFIRVGVADSGDVLEMAATLRSLKQHGDGERRVVEMPPQFLAF